MNVSEVGGRARSFTLPLHPTVALDCQRVGPAVEAEMRAALGGFSEAVVPAPGTTLITVVGASDLERFQPSVRRRKNPDASWIEEDGGEPVLVVRYRQRASLILRLGTPLVLEYEEMAGVAKRVVNNLFTALQIALLRRGDLFCRGAVLLNGDACAVLVGTKGAGKTSLLLRMLEDGWDYLSDDTFLVVDGTACGLRRYIAYSDHHVATAPEIFRAAGLLPRQLRRRRAVRSLFERFLPLDALRIRKVRKLYDPVHRVEPERLFPRVRVVSSAVPSAWIVLRPGDRASLRPLPAAVGVTRVLAAQKLIGSRLEELGHELELHGLGTAFDLRSPIEGALSAAETWELTLPRDEEARRTYLALRDDLASVVRRAARNVPAAAVPGRSGA